MLGYWTRQRCLYTVVLSVVISFIASILIIYPNILDAAHTYNSQSIYNKTKIDFVAPEPSFQQIDELPGTNGINQIFPFYLTKTEVKVNGKSRITNVIMGDSFENLDFTMYNNSRIIEQSHTQYEKPILVDWQFCHDTAAHLGDKVTLSINGDTEEYQIYAIYETNSLYDGGAVLVELTDSQRKAIAANSTSNGYSAMYISASDYNQCRTFLTTEYIPLGRLKDRDQFATNAQYKIHYDAIMSGGYANEITDFRIKSNEVKTSDNILILFIGALLCGAGIILFNFLMSKRGCEKVYFTKSCIPKGQKVGSYYTISYVFETVLLIGLYIILLMFRMKFSSEYIPNSVVFLRAGIIPVVILAAETISLKMNKSMVSDITKKVEEEIKKKEEEKQLAEQLEQNENTTEQNHNKNACENQNDSLEISDQQ